MRSQRFAEIATNELVRKRLAKLMALRCFRNTRLEHLHAGIYPSSQVGDYSDVKVVTPFGEIPWNKVSRLSDEEMKGLMINVVNRCYTFLSELFQNGRGNALMDAMIDALKQHDPLPRWKDPEKTD
jgi:hypothetical protein